jgi:hypothetical protein
MEPFNGNCMMSEVKPAEDVVTVALNRDGIQKVARVLVGTGSDSSHIANPGFLLLLYSPTLYMFSASYTIELLARRAIIARLEVDQISTGWYHKLINAFPTDKSCSTRCCSGDWLLTYCIPNLFCSCSMPKGL